MTIQNGRFYATGAHRVKYFLLDASGVPSFTTVAPATPYAGVDFQGIHKWDIPALKFNQITHVDNDAPVATQQLPPKEMPMATLTVGVNDMDVNAQLQGVKKITIGNMKAVDYMTDKMGFGPTVGLFLYRWAVDKDSDTGTWEWAICPRAKINPGPNSWDAVAQEKSFEVSLNKSKKRLWGVTLTEATDGNLESPYTNGESEYEPVILFWKADGTEDTFTFLDEEGVAIVAASTGSISVWDVTAGAPITTGITKTTADIALDYPPTTDHILCAFFEKAA